MKRVIYQSLSMKQTCRNDSIESLFAFGPCPLHTEFYSIEAAVSIGEFYELKVIPLKLFYYQTFLETWHN